MTEANVAGGLPIRIVDIGDLPADMLDEFYDDVLTPSFPDEELLSPDALAAALADPAGTMCASVVVSDDGFVVGGAVGQWFPECRVLLTVYLATHPGRRGGGIGRAVLRAVRQEWLRRYDPLLILGEAEDPRHHRDRGFGDPGRRLAFYVNEGARVLDVPYFQPRLRPEDVRVPHLLLLAFAIDDRSRRGDGLDAAPVRCFLEKNLLANEGTIGDDPETSALRNAVEGPVVQWADPLAAHHGS
ncbi:GNAT family N-acetyltransferase [Rhodococcus sp. BL-253-APC-6A1W]|uniref:GNAT family N-acetyltransferase n=1 Tax=Rhodococcus sp. BL-253-APC-6A1W TaxID=2725307 RepID=UPI00146E02FE|nr:GNAT family N-acetyltransferase [Rhodococcus sp. BL-253-APC-6A1W]NMD96471.1 GNAT family N-acetyltransferase [Rhodococcus sp. BL-253-APC-6A1W]